MCCDRDHGRARAADDCRSNPDALGTVKKWLESYKIDELVDSKGRPKKEVIEYVPTGKLRIGLNPHAVGGNFYKKLKF